MCTSVCVWGEGGKGKDMGILFIRGSVNTSPAFTVSIMSFCFQLRMCIFFEKVLDIHLLLLNMFTFQEIS